MSLNGQPPAPNGPLTVVPRPCFAHRVDLATDFGGRFWQNAMLYAGLNRWILATEGLRMISAEA
jgi:hypothetical protein